jgi:hypothetical protein
LPTLPISQPRLHGWSRREPVFGPPRRAAAGAQRIGKRHLQSDRDGAVRVRHGRRARRPADRPRTYPLPRRRGRELGCGSIRAAAGGSTRGGGTAQRCGARSRVSKTDPDHRRRPELRRGALGHGERDGCRAERPNGAGYGVHHTEPGKSRPGRRNRRGTCPVASCRDGRHIAAHPGGAGGTPRGVGDADRLGAD